MKINKQSKTKSKSKFIRFAAIIILLVLIVFLVYLQRNNNMTNDPLIQNIVSDSSLPQTNVETERMVKLKELQKENSDIVGWLEIEGTKINYPVLQTDDNDFYMTRDYKKEYSREGSLFLDKDYDWTIPSSNLLIYGHNKIGSTEMFADLIKYKKQDFYNEHKTIRFTTAEEDAEYEIISVFLSRVYYKSEKNVFRYYFFINAETEEEFMDYVNNVKIASLYPIEATAKYGDQLITLSTCEYSQEDGRLAVVARKK